MMRLLPLVRGVFLVILLLLMVGLPLLGFIGAAKITDTPLVAGVISFLATLGIAWPVMLWISRRLAGGKHPVLANCILAVGLCLIGALVYFVFLRQLPGLEVAMPVTPTGCWELPTGSKIAYLKVPARGDRRATPVIRIHGGFSVPDYVFEYDGRPNPRPLDRLAEDGFEVYYYDQIGSGNSARLIDPSAYSIRRDVADLEAIRQALGAEKLALVALSWGSTLAAQYCAAYPNRVAKVVFESPGHLWSGPYLNNSEEKPDCWPPPPERQRREKRVASLMQNPRLIFAMFLGQVNSKLTRRLLSDSEVDRFAGLILKEYGNDQAVCDPKRLPPSAPLGVGGYALLAIANEYQHMSDPRPTLATNPAPALVLRGEAEFLKPEVAKDYLQAFPRSTFVEVKKGGHLLYLEQPEEYLRTVRAFLLDLK
ncbi:MAG: alpha/beta hydrolase [Verrucomicrobia bacterium]|nr:alpha/beta hydrolase [Verrucomicrobiota bacterium]